MLDDTFGKLSKLKTNARLALSPHNYGNMVPKGRVW